MRSAPTLVDLRTPGPRRHVDDLGRALQTSYAGLLSVC